MRKNTTDAELLQAAKTAQFLVIKRWLLSRFIGDLAQISPWSDHYYGISGFSANAVVCEIGSLGQIRKRLRLLADANGIRVIKREYGPVSFLFDRATCDEMAELARLELIAEGYSDTEKRKFRNGN